MVLCCIENVVEPAGTLSELWNYSRADSPLVCSLISKEGTEVGENSDRSSVERWAFLIKAGSKILKGAEVAREPAQLELVLIRKMVPHESDHDNIGMTPGLSKVGVVEVEPVSGRGCHGCNFGDAAGSGKRVGNIFLQQS